MGHTMKLGEKSEKLIALANQRKGDRLVGYTNFKDYHDGAYDNQDYVVPWTISACNVDSDLMLIGQDWNSHDRLSGCLDQQQAELGQIPSLKSNQNTKELLRRFLRKKFSDVYATDLFVFVKPGNMSAGIPNKDLLYSARKYALPQIEIVSPKIVVALGSKTYMSLCRAAGFSSNRSGTPRVGNTYKGAEIIGVTHPGAMSINMRGGIDGVADEWEYVKSRLDIFVK